MINKIVIPALLFAGVSITGCSEIKEEPNVIIIYTDDVGYGDIGCYGGTLVKTPNIDRLAAEGVQFTNAYATASTCTPSRYSLLTGEYHWRVPPQWSVGEIKGVSIAPGDAGLLIDPSTKTLPSIMKDAGYSTAVVGKWHLGLGPVGGPDWNGTITPGPNEIGFDYSFLVPVTGDRVPCVYVENNKVLNLDPNDPILVSYKEQIGPDSLIYNPDVTPDVVNTYEHSEVETNSENGIRMHPSFGHDQSIINGIPRIGFMTGGTSALWKDEKIAETITSKALDFIDKNKNNKFFLYFSTHDIHVPRVPGKKFAGKSGLSVYGDVLMQLDWCVGEIMNKLDELNLSENTMVIFTSDNGPVLNDGYHDGSDKILGTHSPTGIYRGGKYSAFEGSTKVPFIVHWKGRITSGNSEALFSQVDLLASMAALVGYKSPDDLNYDSSNTLPVIMNQQHDDREFVVQQNMDGTLSIIRNGWKYIEPGSGFKHNPYTNPPMEMGNDNIPQLYNLNEDKRETNNVADEFPELTAQLAELLENVKNKSL